MVLFHFQQLPPFLVAKGGQSFPFPFALCPVTYTGVDSCDRRVLSVLQSVPPTSCLDTANVPGWASGRSFSLFCVLVTCPPILSPWTQLGF